MPSKGKLEINQVVKWILILMAIILFSVFMFSLVSYNITENAISQLRPLLE